MPYHIKTHNDLDAVGGRITAEAAGLEIVSTSYHGYDTIDDAIRSYIKNKEFSDGDELLIIDICPSQKTCDRLDTFYRSKGKITLLDHHYKTKAWANKFPWATVSKNKAATELVFDLFYKDDEDTVLYEHFVRAVAAWDLWKLDSPYRRRGEELNTLLGFIGKDEFVHSFAKNPQADFIKPYSEIIRYLERKKNRYINQVIRKQLLAAPYRMDGLGNTFKIIFATDYFSEIGAAALAHPESEDIHYICIINPIFNSVSLRSRQGEVDVHCIAARCGGGGHIAASGFQCSFTESIEDHIFQKLNALER
jgi:oligoribonuclease NrnB/cAMP/cGMP phosphodiesterase (DHH superfamily)